MWSHSLRPLFISLVFLLHLSLAFPPRRSLPRTITRTTTRADPRLDLATAPSDLNEAYIDNYVEFHKAQTQPLDLWDAHPRIVASHYMPGNANQAKTLLYLDALEKDDAYIHPQEDPWLKMTKKRMKSLVRSEADVSVEKQRSFLALYEDLKRQSAFRIQTALHPHNVRAQHKTAIERRIAHLTELTDAVEDDANRRKLTSGFDDDQGLRFFRAHQVLSTELDLLKEAKLFASEVPHLVE